MIKSIKKGVDSSEEGVKFPSLEQEGPDTCLLGIL